MGSATAQGFARQSSVPGYASEEQMAIVIPLKASIKIGGRIELIPFHGCTSCNLYSEYIACETVW
jgi:D-serine deaminase-like pyridoxal phosphate-dependent protein